MEYPPVVERAGGVGVMFSVGVYCAARWCRGGIMAFTATISS